MKKSTKVILITAAVLVGVGTVLALIAGFAGGAKQFVLLAQKGAFSFEIGPKLKIVDYDFLATWIDDDEGNDDFDADGFDADGFDADDFDADDFDADDFDANDFDDDFEQDMTGYTEVNAHSERRQVASMEDGIKSLDIAIGAGVFTLAESEDDNFYIEDSESCSLYVRQSGECLSIRTKGIQSFFYIGSEEGRSATIYLPKKEYEQVTVCIGAGTLDGKRLSAKQLDVEIGAGKMNMDTLQASKLELLVGAGKCNVSELIAEETEIELGMGKLKADSVQIGKELEMGVGMGSADLEIAGGESDYNYNIECGAGSVDIGDNSYNSIITDEYINNHADKDIEIDCDMGSLKISFEK